MPKRTNVQGEHTGREETEFRAFSGRKEAKERAKGKKIHNEQLSSSVQETQPGGNRNKEKSKGKRNIQIGREGWDRVLAARNEAVPDEV
jgi:hypothetical protein